MSKDLDTSAYQSLESDFEQLMTAWIEKDEKNDSFSAHNNTDLSSLQPSYAQFPLLSQNRYDLLEILESHGTTSIYRLCELTGRQYMAVETDINKLVLARLVKWIDADMLVLNLQENETF